MLVKREQKFKSLSKIILSLHHDDELCLDSCNYFTSSRINAFLFMYSFSHLFEEELKFTSLQNLFFSERHQRWSLVEFEREIQTSRVTSFKWGEIQEIQRRINLPTKSQWTPVASVVSSVWILQESSSECMRLFNIRCCFSLLFIFSKVSPHYV